MRFNRTIAAKLVIAYALFLAPIGFLTYHMIADKEANIDFARKEITGVHYVAEVRRVQDAVVAAATWPSLPAKFRPTKTSSAATSKRRQPQNS